MTARLGSVHEDAGEKSSRVEGLLLTGGAGPAAHDLGGDTARSVARRRGQAGAESLLAGRGAPDPAAEPPTGGDLGQATREQLLEARVAGARRRLLLAISAGDVAAVVRLVRAGIVVDGHDPATGGSTALTRAAYCNRREVVRRLLDLGAAV